MAGSQQPPDCEPAIRQLKAKQHPSKNVRGLCSPVGEAFGFWVSPDKAAFVKLADEHRKLWGPGPILESQGHNRHAICWRGLGSAKGHARDGHLLFQAVTGLATPADHPQWVLTMLTIEP